MNKLVILTGILVLAASSSAWGDGMVFGEWNLGGDAYVQATAQRAVLLLRDGTWEVHIQPVFLREDTEHAWVVPFPVRPLIEEGDVDLFDQLELLTSPVFMTTCTDRCTSYGGDGGVEAGEVSGGAARITVWESGRVGALDYVVLSARDGDSLLTWLESAGFMVPEKAEEPIRSFETEESFFFAARQAAEVAPSVSLAPVRFVLPGLETPTYPLRLTALGLSGHQALDLTLWVVAPASQAFVPDSHGYDTFDLFVNPRDADGYDWAVEDFFRRRPAMLLMRFAREIDEARMQGHFCPDHRHDAGLGGCLSFREAGIEEIPAWTAEVERMVVEESLVARYHGRLDAVAMARDLTFRELDASGLVRTDSIYVHHAGACRDCADPDPDDLLDQNDGGGCSTSGFAGTFLGGLVLAAGIALSCLRKRSGRVLCATTWEGRLAREKERTRHEVAHSDCGPGRTGAALGLRRR